MGNTEGGEIYKRLIIKQIVKRFGVKKDKNSGCVKIIKPILD
jgi:hypothetical protein